MITKEDIIKRLEQDIEKYKKFDSQTDNEELGNRYFGMWIYAQHLLNDIKEDNL